MMARGAAEQEVWEREVASWEHLKAGDVKSFLSLFHDEVMAWPDGRPAPVDKNAIFQHLVAILPMLQAQALTVELTPLSIRVFDNVAVVQYEAHMRYATKPGGRAVRDDIQRYTRTWLRTGQGWQLIAGMSAPSAAQSP
jgi:Domain of unknown function (DUF4440)